MTRTWWLAEVTFFSSSIVQNRTGLVAAHPCAGTDFVVVDVVIASLGVTKTYLVNLSYDVVREKHHRRFCQEDWDRSLGGAVKDKEHEPNSFHIFCPLVGEKLNPTLFHPYKPYMTFIYDPLCQYPGFLYLEFTMRTLLSRDLRYRCSSIPHLMFSFLPTLVLSRMRDIPPCCAFGGRKRGLRRKLCRSFSFLSLSHASNRSCALGSSFHFGLRWVRF